MCISNGNIHLQLSLRSFETKLMRSLQIYSICTGNCIVKQIETFWQNSGSVGWENEHVIMYYLDVEKFNCKKL